MEPILVTLKIKYLFSGDSAGVGGGGVCIFINYTAAYEER